MVTFSENANLSETQFYLYELFSLLLETCQNDITVSILIYNGEGLSNVCVCVFVCVYMHTFFLLLRRREASGVDTSQSADRGRRSQLEASITQCKIGWISPVHGNLGPQQHQQPHFLRHEQHWGLQAKRYGWNQTGGVSGLFCLCLCLSVCLFIDVNWMYHFQWYCFDSDGSSCSSQAAWLVWLGVQLCIELHRLIPTRFWLTGGITQHWVTQACT